MENPLEKLVESFVVERTTSKGDFVGCIRERYFVSILLIGLFLSPWLFVAEGLQFGFLSPISIVNLFWISLFMISLRLVYKDSPIVYPTFLTIFAVSTGVFFTAYNNLGIYDPSFFWLVFTPLSASLLAGRKLALVVTGVTTIGTILFFLLIAQTSGGNIPKNSGFFLQLIYVIAPIIFSGVFSFSFDKIIEATSSRLALSQKNLVDEKQKVFQSQKLASLGEMAGGIAHEINNPLSILKGYTQVIVMKVQQQDFQDLNAISGKLSQSVDRVATIVDGLLHFARDGSKDPREMWDPKDLVDQALGLNSEKMKRNAISVSLSFKHDSQKLWVQKVSLLQVLSNILNNAIDALESLDFSDEKRIEISTSIGPGILSLTISNNGPEIPESTIGKIMDPFFTTKTVGEGTGIGLSISSSILKEHQGHLKVHSDKEQTAFTLQLPIGDMAKAVA